MNREPFDLTFWHLTSANLARVKTFKNGKGEVAHPNGVGDWSPNDWCLAALGELGELANVLKKVNRGDFTIEEAKKKIMEELAGTVIYLDLLASRLGIDLAQAVIYEFNRKSDQLGLEVHL